MISYVKSYPQVNKRRTKNRSFVRRNMGSFGGLRIDHWRGNTEDNLLQRGAADRCVLTRKLQSFTLSFIR